MAWRTLATVLIVVFAAVMVWMVTAGPVVQLGDDFKDLDESDGNVLDPTDAIDGLLSSYFNVFLVLIFGIMSWGVWVVFRREITRQGGGGQL